MSTFVTSSYLLAFAYVPLLGPNAGIVNRLIMKAVGLEEPPFDIYSFAGYVFIATLEGVPLVFLTCAAALRSVDGSLENAARMVGAGSLRIITTITLPLEGRAVAPARQWRPVWRRWRSERRRPDRCAGRLHIAVLPQ